MAMATGIPTLFLDKDMRIARFTPTITAVYPLRENDVGRPLDDFSNSIGLSGLSRRAREVLHSRQPKEIIWEVPQQHPYLIRLVPYHEAAYGSEALVVMFIDVHALTQSQFVQDVLDSLVEHVVVVDGDGIIQLTNRAWTDFARDNGGDLDLLGPGSNYLSSCQPVADDSTAREAAAGLRHVLAAERETFSLEYPCHSPDGEQRWFLMHAARLHNRDGAVISHIRIAGREKDSGSPQSG
jgi:two-component system CheB/CheR fusion protein